MPETTPPDLFAQDELPEPLAALEVDCRGLDFMPLDVARLRDSDLVALSSGDGFKAAVLLWAKAWWEIPAGSLPNVDLILAKACGLSEREFLKVREEALRGWILCADGRLYHPVIVDFAEKAFKNRRNQRERAESRWAKERAKSQGKTVAAKSPRKSAGNAAALPANMQGRGRGRDSDSNESDANRVVAELRKYPNGEFNAWNMCLGVLWYLGGVTGSPARSFVGKLKSQFKLTDEDLAEIANATWAEKTQDPAAFMRKCAERRGEGSEDERPEWIERKWVAEFVERAASWDYRRGPAPDQKFCKMRPSVLAEFGFEVLK